MKITDRILKGVIAETINEYYYGRDEEEGDVNLSIDDLIEMMPDSEEKARLVSDPDLIDELLPEMAYDYSIMLGGDYHEDRGDYWTPPNSWIDNVYIKSDDNLLANIQSVQNEILRNGLIMAYKDFEERVKDGEFNDAFE